MKISEYLWSVVLTRSKDHCGDVGLAGDVDTFHKITVSIVNHMKLLYFARLCTLGWFIAFSI